MTSRFLSRQFSWRRVSIGVLIGAVILLVLALLFVYLAARGLLTRV